ncbi:MAG: tryptophan--tRNA ligase [Planctomycetia bacterium]
MRLLSGVKPTHRPHVGNYFGAMRQFVALQQRGPCFFFVADLHALNQVHDAALLREYSLGVALDYLAIGLDPARATLFVQSHVPEVSELDWILGTVTPMGLLQRAHAYKDALAKEKEVEFGLFAYPVLMAADILLYRADCVPVGKDQVQHVEITRDIAVKFNTLYCKGFDPKTGQGGALVLPEALVQDEVAVVPGTDGRKMSKSYGNTIPLFGSEKEVKKAIMGIVTDSTSVDASKDPSGCNVFQLLRLFLSPDEQRALAERYRRGGEGYGAYKTLLLERFHDHLGPARRRREELARNLDHVHALLRQGAQRARAEAGEVLAAVQRACGVGASGG